MTFECFTANIKIIEKLFNAVIPPARVELIKKKFMILPDGDWIRICDQIVGYERTLPTMKEFEKYGKEFLANFKKTGQVLGEIRPREIAQCFDCGDSGFIRLCRNAKFEPWALWASGSAPCHCQRGRLLIDVGKKLPGGRAIDFGPPFTNDWLKSYTIVPAYEQTLEESPIAK